MGAKIPGANTNTAINNADPVNTSGAPAAGITAPNLLELITGQYNASRCGEDARKYIDAISLSLKDNNKRVTSIPIPNDKVEGRAWIDEDTKCAIVMIFAETNNSFDSLPASKRGPELAATFRSMRQDIPHVISSIVIDKIDYVNADKMATCIMNSFQAFQLSRTPLTIDSLRGQKFAVITNQEKVRAYVQEISPHAVPARDDIGVLLCIEEPKKQVPGVPYNQFEKDYKPVFAITGYTRIMSPEQGGSFNGMMSQRFVPIPTISDIVTSLPDRRLLAMALPIAADAFIMQSIWSRPYTSFAKDRPNLGSLMLDSKTKQPMFLGTSEDLNSFANMFLTRPFLAIDVADGRYRMFGIDDLVYNMNSVVSAIDNFLNPTPAPGVKSPFENIVTNIMNFENFTGTVQIDGRPVDSRYIDYLSLATKCTDIKRINHFLTQPYKPGERLEQIREFFPETKALYNVNTLILDASFITLIATGLGNKLSLTYDTPASGSMNMTQLLTSVGNNFGSFNNFAKGFGPTFNNPGMGGNPYM